jgi:hypothetical protein
MTPRPHWTTFARGKRKERGKMNQTETAYSKHLEGRKLAGEIVGFWYEAVTFKLTEGTPDGKPGIRYTPDFLVMLTTGEIELHEVKGFANKLEMNRIKVAADKFPFRFIAVKRQAKRDGGGWQQEEF